MRNGAQVARLVVDVSLNALLLLFRTCCIFKAEPSDGLKATCNVNMVRCVYPERIYFWLAELDGDFKWYMAVELDEW